MRLKIFLLFIILIFIGLKPHSVSIAAPSPLPVRIFGLQVDGYIKVYTLNKATELIQTGSITLPEGFEIKKYPQRPNIILSPSGDKAAFTAKNQDDETGLFIYDFGTDELEQGFIARFTNFFMHLVWSPDGNFVMLEPIYQDGGRGELPYPETYTYELATKRWSALTKNPGRTGERFIWMRNSQSLRAGRFFTDNPDKMILVDPYGTTLKALESAPELPLPGCDVNWFEAAQRWYYNMDCAIYGGDIPPVNEAIYSMDEAGDIRLELDMEAFFPEVDQKDDYEADTWVVAVETGDKAIYAFANVRFLKEIANQQKSIVLWRVVRIIAPDEAEIVFEYVASDHQLMQEGSISPDEQHILMWQRYGETKKLIAVDLETDTIVVEKTSSNSICAAQWINATQVLYNECGEGNYGNIYRVDLLSGNTVQLTQGEETEFILLAPVRSNIW